MIITISFGYGHGPAPEADLTADVRRHLHNPHADPAMRRLTGLDDAVRRHVLDTPGARPLAQHITAAARDLADIAPDVVVAIGCVGGRHRSVALAEEIAAALRGCGVRTQIEHRDVTKPVIQP